MLYTSVILKEALKQQLLKRQKKKTLKIKDISTLSFSQDNNSLQNQPSLKHKYSFKVSSKQPETLNNCELTEYANKNDKHLYNDNYYKRSSLIHNNNNQTNPYILYINKKGRNLFHRHSTHVRVHTNLTPYQKLHKRNERMKKLINVKRYINSDHNNIYKVNNLLTESTIHTAISASNIYRSGQGWMNNNKMVNKRVNSMAFLNKYSSRPLTGMKLKNRKIIMNKNNFPTLNFSSIRNERSYPNTDRGKHSQEMMKWNYSNCNNLTSRSNYNGVYDNGIISKKVKHFEYLNNRAIKLKNIIFNNEINI